MSSASPGGSCFKECGKVRETERCRGKQGGGGLADKEKEGWLAGRRREDREEKGWLAELSRQHSQGGRDGVSTGCQEQRTY